MPKSPIILALCAVSVLSAGPAFALRGDASPSPLPINGVTVDVRRHHAGANNYNGEHVERPFGPHGSPRHHGQGHPRPLPTPTP